MSLHANFLKRAFAFIVDLTIVILATMLLYVFPFQQIIGKSIDSDYKNNIGNVVDAVNIKYSGEQSAFGSTSLGLLGVLDNINSNGESETYKINQEEMNDLHNSLKEDTIDLINTFIPNSSSVYNSELELKDQFYTDVYAVYGYTLYIYKCLSAFPMNENYEYFEQLKIIEEWTDDELEQKEKDYSSALLSEFIDVMKTCLITLDVYGKTNELNIEKTTAYETILKQYNSVTNVKITETELTSEAINRLISFINRYGSFYNHFVVENEPLNSGRLTKEAYYAYYYNYLTAEFNELLNVYEAYNSYSFYTVLYALSMFTLLFSLYAVLLKGNTIGRKIDKIYLTDGAEKEKANPLKVLLHDVLFRFLYLIIIGCFDLRVMFIAAIVFTIADAIMVKFTKDHKTIRDYLSGTKVIQKI